MIDRGRLAVSGGIYRGLLRTRDRAAADLERLRGEERPISSARPGS